MATVLDRAFPVLETGDDIAVADVLVRCPKCTRRHTTLIEGFMAPGTAVRLKCPRCRELITLRTVKQQQDAV
jgi:phage FluMu protein Com